jgi:hypothetical protein
VNAGLPTLDIAEAPEPADAVETTGAVAAADPAEAAEAAVAGDGSVIAAAQIAPATERVPAARGTNLECLPVTNDGMERWRDKNAPLVIARERESAFTPEGHYPYVSDSCDWREFAP